MAKYLSDEDVALLKQEMRNVAPLKTAGRVVHGPAARPANVALKRERASTPAQHPGAPLSDSTYDPSSGTNHSYQVSGLSSEVLRRLRREGHNVKASLDLHGLTIDQAREQLHQFIRLCCDHGYKRVRVVHGQGFGSATGTSVLRQQARHWLSQMPEVLGYVSPNHADGGEGAVLVLLRSAQKVNQR